MVRISWEHIENNKNPTTPISPKIAWAPWALGARRFVLCTCVLHQFLAQANGRKQELWDYACMFEILGKHEDKSTILTYKICQKITISL
jgi:hypothetical protein